MYTKDSFSLNNFLLNLNLDSRVYFRKVTLKKYTTMEKLSIKYLLMLLIAGLFVMNGCKDDDEDTNMMTDTEFMQFAAQSGLFEIQSSQLASQKSTTTEVIAFAQQMVADHTVQSQELDSLAAVKNISLSKTLPAAKQAIVNRLNGENGATFDKDYINEQIASHDETIINFEKAASGAKDADVKAFANKYLPALRMHRQHAATVKAVTDAL
jgi:putative membrane protein